MSIDKQIEAAEEELALIEAKRGVLLEKIRELKALAHTGIAEPAAIYEKPLHNVTRESPESEKIALFRSLFRGREDVFPRRFESKRTGKSGYQPACSNAWYRLVKSYQGLNSGKFKIIHKLEKRLPLSPYDAEWEIVGRGEKPKLYLPFTNVEMIVPWVFFGLHLFVFLKSVAWDKIIE